MTRALVALLAACGGADSPAPSNVDAGGIANSVMDAPGDTGAALRVFVSSLRYPADLQTAGGQATGLASADHLCQTLADAVSLGGTFRAWISTSQVNAIDHITGTGPWYRIDGALAFPNHARLGTTPVVPISIDEAGGSPDPFYEAWTGTALGGYKAANGARDSVTCLDWTSTIDSETVGGVVGDIDDNAAWTSLAVGYCSPFSRRLYCFEQ